MNVKCCFTLCCALTTTACSDNLNTLDGPKSGTVSGLACKALPILSATVEMPSSKEAFIRDGQCLSLKRSQQVDILRTVMMPGDGKYSQFEISVDDSTFSVWIETRAIVETH